MSLITLKKNHLRSMYLFKNYHGHFNEEGISVELVFYLDLALLKLSGGFLNKWEEKTIYHYLLIPKKIFN